MKIELGKCYEHTTGQKIRMLQEIDTDFYVHCILGETNSRKYILCGFGEDNAVNYKECEDFTKIGEQE